MRALDTKRIGASDMRRFRALPERPRSICRYCGSQKRSVCGDSIDVARRHHGTSEARRHRCVDQATRADDGNVGHSSPHFQG